MWCFYQDYLSAIEYYEDDFVYAFGYEEKEGKKVYKQLMKEYERLEELFDNDTLNILEKEFEDY